MATKVFLLRHFLDNWRNRGFAFVDRGGVFSWSRCIDAIGMDKRPTLHRDSWGEPRAVIGSVPKKYDYVTIGGSLPAFSERTVDILGDVLRANGELLPLAPPVRSGKWWAYNCTNVIEALDLNQSEMYFYAPGDYVAGDITRHVFIEEMVEGAKIFRVPSLIHNIYLTEEVARRIVDAKLYGAELAKVWPLPDGTSWKKLFKHEAALREDEERSRRKWKKTDGITPAINHPFKKEQIMAITRRDLTAEEQQGVIDARQGYLPGLGIHEDEWGEKVYLQILEDQLQPLRNGQVPADSSDGKSLIFWVSMACGDIFVKQLGWHWCMLVKAGDEALAVSSPDASLAIPVFVYIKRLANASKSELNIQLLFNMVAAGEFTGKSGELKIIG